MFGLFKKPKYEDTRLGVFQRAQGRWNGTIQLDRLGEIPLRLSGDKKSPDSTALFLVHELHSHIGTLLPQIQESLFEHYEPYRDAFAEGGLPEGGDPFPFLESASDVLPHVYPRWVDISPLKGAPSDGPVIEIAYDVAWDEEHTVGARIQDWKLFELCGSTV